MATTERAGGSASANDAPNRKKNQQTGLAQTGIE